MQGAVALNVVAPEDDAMAMVRQRAHLMSKPISHVQEDDDDEVRMAMDDPFIDFSSAALYLVGLQTTLATMACAGTSIACCWLLPPAMISAVRTLALTSVVGVVCMRKPLRVGRVRGVITLFNALRPCVALYIGLLTMEQLLHVCTSTTAVATGTTRRVVFHSTIAGMAVAGFWRAARPLSETDLPFLVTAAGAVIIAILPPPAAPLSGPLCQSPTMFAAGERVVRALLFAALYTLHVYCSPPRRNSIVDLSTCIVRAGAAAVWILGAHLFVVWVALVQAGVALWARFGSESAPGGAGGEFGVYGGAYSGSTYASVDTFSDGGMSDAELGNGPALERDANGVLIPEWQKDAGLGARYHGFSNSENILQGLAQSGPQEDQYSAAASGASPMHPDDGGVPVDARQLASLVGQTKSCGVSGPSSARMAQIAATIR
jgi:hypothetical protein